MIKYLHYEHRSKKIMLKAVDYIIIFTLQILAIPVGQYLLAWFKESGKLAALGEKEKRDLKEKEKKEG